MVGEARSPSSAALPSRSRGETGRERAEIEALRVLQILGLGHRPAVDGRFVGERAVRNVGDGRAAILHAQPAVGGDLANPDGVQIPLVEDPFDFRLAAALDDQQHALLRLREHDLVGRHAGLALRHERHVDLHADAAARSHLRGRAGEARRSHVLNADERVRLHHLETGLEQQLFHERIAHLHGRALLRRFIVELRRRHRRPVNAVAARLGADVIHRVPDARGDALDDVGRRSDAEAEHVDERVAGVARLEHDLAADGRDADAVPVAGDAGDDAFEHAPRAWRVERSETQRVQQRDRPRAHREDVADDPADAGRGALVWLDERRVVVRFDLEDRGEPAADVHGAGVLAGALQHLRPFGRQRLQMHARALVAAVLGPHHREDAELGQVRLAAEERRRCGRTRRAFSPCRSRT